MSAQTDLGTVAAFFREKANCYATCASACDNVATIGDQPASVQMLAAMQSMWKSMTAKPWPVK